MIKNIVQEIVEGALRKACEAGSLGGEGLPAVKIEYPKEEKFGDYATPVALESAKILKRSPLDIGTVLKEYIGSSSIFERVEVVRPGFVNMFLSTAFLHDQLKEIVTQGEKYGNSNIGAGKRVNIEFVSANPTGPMVVVNARAASVGDTIANLLEAAGYGVEREFYVNDYGNQVRLLGLSVLMRCRELKGESVVFPEDGYHGGYVRDIAASIMERFEHEISSIGDEEELIDFMACKAVEYNLEGQKKDLGAFNVRFDTWFSERTIHENAEVADMLTYLEEKGFIEVQDGKKVFMSTRFGDDKDRVVVRDDGRPTYLLADMAYHRNKVGRGYDIIIDIWGPDHHGYIQRVRGAMEAIGFPAERFHILISQQVNLVTGGETVKVSKRQGTFTTMSELVEDIGVDVSRYFFIMRSLESHLDFDLSLAKKESSENPVFYLQYAHARICSIFREASKRGMDYDPAFTVQPVLDNRESIALMKLLTRFPEEVHDAALSFEPQRIAGYLLKLAQLFHKFYTEHRVLTDDRETANTLLVLCDAARIVLKRGLNLLGVSAPERM